MSENTQDIKQASKQMRLDILRLAHNAGKKGAHIAPSLSMVEIMSVLFTSVMRHGADDFILSKGHGGLCYYTALYQGGLITKEQLDTFEINGGSFPGQPSRCEENPVIYSSGSLGLGLSYAAGIAWEAKRKRIDKKVYVLLGDGELNEGSVWEAVMFGRQRQLSNLIAIVDWNGMQSDGYSKDIIHLDIENIWKSHGWNVVCCNGHNEEDLLRTFHYADRDKHKEPTVILAKTVKGKGVSFMENDRVWHHNHLNDEQYQKAIAEVEARNEY
jgi:transketolase